MNDDLEAARGILIALLISTAGYVILALLVVYNAH